MTREFPDELLSAFLDGELSPDERAQVEKHLASSEADRLLLSELQALRSEVAALPPAAMSPDFADRVVRAAVAEAEKHNPAAAAASLPPPAASRSSRRWLIGAAVASAAALAASILLVLSFWRRGLPPAPDEIVKIDADKATEQIVAASDHFLKTLYAAVPSEGEAVVLRLRVSKDVPFADALNASLVKAGMAPLDPNSPTGAAAIAAAYAKALEAKFGPAPQGAENKALLDATVTAAQALFVEAPLESLEGMLRSLSEGLKQPLELDAQCKLAFTRQKIEQGEGEPGSKSAMVEAGKAFAQQLDAARFRLEKKLAQAATSAANSSSSASPNPKQLVRVLLLVETE
jgi:hypothetical protein